MIEELISAIAIIVVLNIIIGKNQEKRWHK